MAELSIVSVCLIIAIGVLVVIILFILGKRQIIRFTLKSTRRPHIPIGSAAPKAMRMEIERRLEHVKNIHVDPVLWTERIQQMSANIPNNHYHYRMKALDAYTNAIESLKENYSDMILQTGTQSMEQYLFSLCPECVDSPTSTIIRQFASAYQHARHDPGDFEELQFVSYMEILDQIIRLIKASLSKGRTTFSDTEVILQPGKNGFSDGVVFVQHAKSRSVANCFSSNDKVQYAQQLQQRSRGDGAESIPLADSGLSSGSSSGQPLSNGLGSSENLISSAHSLEREDAL